MRTLRCPICRRPVQLGEPDFPFCSDRCREVDLGNWATEQYRIPAGPAAGVPELDDE